MPKSIFILSPQPSRTIVPRDPPWSASPTPARREEIRGTPARPRPVGLTDNSCQRRGLSGHRLAAPPAELRHELSGKGVHRAPDRLGAHAGMTKAESKMGDEAVLQARLQLAQHLIWVADRVCHAAGAGLLAI